MSKRIAFTLAEIMIVLAVIGVLTAVLLPVAINSTPNEDVMKFKKGHNALLTTIRELVNSDKYYLDGNLAKRASGEYITGKNAGDVTYFCESFADIISTKSINCNDTYTSYADASETTVCSDWSDADIVNNMDTYCKNTASKIGAEIATSDNIIFYQSSTITFGMDDYVGTVDHYLYLETVGEFNSSPENSAKGIDSAYRCSKVFCMDIDGIDNGEDPFGYGIRADGKVLLGARADEWLQKSIQEKE